MRTRAGVALFRCGLGSFIERRLVPIPTNDIGNANANVPYLRLIRRIYAPGCASSLLRMLDGRHIRLVTAKVKQKLEHCGKGIPILFFGAYIVRLISGDERFVNRVDALQSVGQRTCTHWQRDHARLIAVLSKEGRL